MVHECFLTEEHKYFYYKEGNMIISSEAVYPRKRYVLKKSKEEIIREINILENHRRIMSKKNVPKKKEEVKEYEFIVYTDGGHSGTYRIGSWSYFIKAKHDKKRFLFHKASGANTANMLPILMELTAVIKALQYIKEKQKDLSYAVKSVAVYSDNRQVVNSDKMFNLYAQNDWFYLRKGVEMDARLKDAWMEIHGLNESLDIKYTWVRGHSGVPGNERCDEACTTRLKQSIRVKKIIRHNDQVFKKIK
jgi:ribonuclease HI